MNLLNHKVLVENSIPKNDKGEIVLSEDAKPGKGEYSCAEGYRTVALGNPSCPENIDEINTDTNSVIDGKATQINLDNTIHTLKMDDISDLDDIEDRIKVNDLDDFDDLSESIFEIDRELEEIGIILENGIAKAHAAQYNLLSECVGNDDIDSKLGLLYETSLSSLWKSFIEALEKFIKKAKDFMSDLCFNAVAHFDLYGKWAAKYEEALKNADKSSSGGVTKKISIYDWKREKIFQMTDFSRLHEYASTIIGKATTVEDMERKLDAYEKNNYSSDDIYNYILSKCCGLHIGVTGSKSESMKKVLNKIKGNKVETDVTRYKVDTAIADLKAVRSHVLKYASRTRFAILNPEFDVMLREAKREMSAASSDKDNTKYKYFRTRYTVLSKAQEVAFDIYSIKIRTIKEYAKTCKEICEAYISKPINESVDFLSMNNEIASNAVVLD